jgi:hypothetical protein
MSSLERRVATVPANQLVHSATEGNATSIADGEMKQRLLLRQVILIAAMVLAMTGWVYALGWVAIKLI